MKLLSTCAVAALALTAALPATASMVVNVTEQGDDVVFEYDGTLSLVGLNRGDLNIANSHQEAQANQRYNVLLSIDNWDSAQGNATSFDFTGPQTTFVDYSGVSSGDNFGFVIDSSGLDYLYFGANYIAGDQISGSLTFANKSLSNFGFADGTSYSFTFGTADTVTVNYGSAAQRNAPSPSAVPLPAGAPLLLAGIGAFAGLRARKKAKAA